jgi:activator of 2-hydroxyglutaryl-CoA dehydratase
MRRVGVEPEVTFTGGVTRNIGMVQGLNEALGFTVNVSEESHYMGALGAALFARDHILSSRKPAARLEVR